MSKIGFYLLGLFSGMVLPSLYAWKHVDEANRTKPEVRILKEYEGGFRGWSDYCPNCGQTLNKVVHTPEKKPSEQHDAYRMGYCECNCKQKTRRE